MITGRPINLPGERFPGKLTDSEAVPKELNFQPVSSTKALDVYKMLERLKSYRVENVAGLNTVETLAGIEVRMLIS